MDALSSTTDSRNRERHVPSALTVVFLSWVLGSLAVQAGAVTAESPIFGDPATPVVSTAPGKTSGNAQAVSAAAADSLPLPAEDPQPLPGFFSTFLRLILALGITVGLIYLTIWGLKVFWEKRGFAGSSDEGKPIRVLSSAYLAPRKAVHLVEVGERILVVASGNEEVHPLDVITEPGEVEALRKTARQGFPEVFGKFMNRSDAREHASEAQKIVSEGREAVGRYLDKVRGVSKGMQKNSDEEDS